MDLKTNNLRKKMCEWLSESLLMTFLAEE